MCFQTRELSYPTALQTCFTHSTFHKCSQGPPLTFCTAQQHLMQISTTEIFPFCAMHGILAISQGSAFHSFPGQGWHNTLIETVLSAWCCRLKNICRDIAEVHLPATKQAGHHKESYHQFHPLFLSKQMIMA